MTEIKIYKGELIGLENNTIKLMDSSGIFREISIIELFHHSLNFISNNIKFEIVYTSLLNII